jgi:Nuclease-related domain
MDTSRAAGRSASQEHRRRRAAAVTARRQALPGLVASIVFSIAAAGGVVLGLGWLVSAGLHAAIGARLPGSLVRECAATAAVAAAVLAAAPAWRATPATRAWQVGADGEAITAAALVPLKTEGWNILHDRRMPGRRDNIDHVAVGPGGVWVIETKNWSGRLVVGADRLRSNGRAAEGLYDQVWRQADAVTAALPRVGVRARPAVCVVGGQLVHGRDHAGRRVHGPVEFHTCESLARRLRGAPTVLTPAQVANVTTALVGALPPA